MDHVKPKSLGGPKTWENIVTSCKACNTKKKNKTPKQANMPLLRRPFSPRVRMVDLYRNINIEEEWEQFL
jgi:5-methylcytosine-specific restriction endonuclease McrA